jgi:hypothetical protein
MKKRIVYFGLGLLLSCGSHSHQAEPKPLVEILSQQVDGGARIPFFEFLTEPKEIKMLQNDPQLGRKINTEDLKACNFVLANLGEKETEGYQWQLDQVSETKDSIYIIMNEIPPTKPNPAEKDIYYTPFTVLKINSKKPIRIN